MKGPMTSPGDNLLHTPVVSLSEVFPENLSASVEPSSNARGRKRKHLLNSKVRNARRINRAAEESCRKMKRIKNEEFSLQLQRAMIADEDGDRLLHIAVSSQEDATLVKHLCQIMTKGGLSLDVKNRFRQTPLHIAVLMGNTEAICILTRLGASLHYQDRNGFNPIHLAIKHFNENVLSTLLCHQDFVALNACDYEGLSPLHHAVSNCNAAAVQILCSAGANVDSVDGKSGRSCLAHAVLSGKLDMVTLLLQFNANVEKTDYSGQNVLELALHTGNRNIIRILEKKSNKFTLGESSTDFATPKKRKRTSSSSKNVQ